MEYLGHRCRRWGWYCSVALVATGVGIIADAAILEGALAGEGIAATEAITADSEAVGAGAADATAMDTLEASTAENISTQAETVGESSAEGTSKLAEVDQTAKNSTLSDETYSNHILDRHGPNSTVAKKSVFNSSFDIRQGISDTLSSPNSLIRPNSFGRSGYIFENTYENPIGINKFGSPINTLKVVLGEDGSVITAFPK